MSPPEVAVCLWATQFACGYVSPDDSCMGFFYSFPQARAFTSLHQWLHLLFDFFLFVQSLGVNLYASFHWLSLRKVQVGNGCG